MLILQKSFKNEMFNKEEFKMAEDKFEQAKGNIKETVGNATDNKDLEKKVKATKLGKAKEVVDNVKDKANDVIDKLKAINKSF